MKCDRCFKTIRNPDTHGWQLCEYLPRQSTFSTNTWSQKAWREKEHHSDDIIQPIDRRGNINDRFVKIHGTKELQKQWKMSDREIREKAK